MHYTREAEAKGKSDREGSILELILADGRVFPHKGKLYFADRQVDEGTGTIKVATLFPNPGNILRPGQFAKIKALIDTQIGALLVPQRAVTELQGRYQVAVVGPDNKVDLRWVKVGERAGSLWVIDEGLKPGEQRDCGRSPKGQSRYDRHPQAVSGGVCRRGQPPPPGSRRGKGPWHAFSSTGPLWPSSSPSSW